jgi:hypothetical protein
MVNGVASLSETVVTAAKADMSKRKNYHQGTKIQSNQRFRIYTTYWKYGIFCDHLRYEPHGMME